MVYFHTQGQLQNRIIIWPIIGLFFITMVFTPHPCSTMGLLTYTCCRHAYTLEKCFMACTLSCATLLSCLSATASCGFQTLQWHSLLSCQFWFKMFAILFPLTRKWRWQMGQCYERLMPNHCLIMCTKNVKRKCILSWRKFLRAFLLMYETLLILLAGLTWRLLIVKTVCKQMLLHLQLPQKWVIALFLPMPANWDVVYEPVIACNCSRLFLSLSEITTL